MINKIIYTAIILFFFSCVNVKKTSTYNSKLETTEYINPLIQKVKGKLLVLRQEDNRKEVSIKWSNGFFSLGSFIDDKESGEWFTFDKKGNLRKKIFFGNGTVFQVTEYDKKGNMINRTTFSVPW